MIALYLSAQAAASENNAAVILTDQSVSQENTTPSSDALNDEPFESQELLAMLDWQDAAVNTDSNPINSSEENSVTDFHRTRQDFLFEEIRSLEQPNILKQTRELDAVIRQLRSLDISPKMKTKTGENSVQQRVTENSPDVLINDPVKPEKSEPIVQQESAVEKDLLSRLAKNPEALYPLRLADTLFRQQYYDRALELYEQSYPSLSENDVANRQWVMFQMANCCQSTDPAKAIKLYNDLIQSYPNCEWSLVANGRKAILEWNQSSRIETIITKDIDVSSQH